MLKTPSSLSTVTLSDGCASHPSTMLSTSDIVDNTDTANTEIHVSVPAETSVTETSVEAFNLKPAVASHVPQSFRRRFSQKLKENVHPTFQSDSFQPLAVPVSESSLKISSTSEVAKSHQKPSTSELVSVSSSSEACRTIHGSSECFTPAGVTPATPSKPVEYTESKDGSMKNIEPLSTPARFVSTPSRLMTTTPALKPPKALFASLEGRVLEGGK
jgi:chromatin licensing and DNA replication factor 1